MKLTQYKFASTQYFAETHPKTQIYLHHTAGNADPYAVFDFWSSNPDRICTAFAVGGKAKAGGRWVDGEVVQGFDAKYWGYHLGLKQETFTKFKIPYTSLDKISIGIEMCNYGQLSYKDGKYYTYVGSTIPAEDVIELATPHRGYKFYHAYTDAQIAAVKELILSLHQTFNIPIKYNEDIWDVTTRALKAEPGLYTHNSVRFDKVDASPQPKLIEMLKSL